MLAADHNQQQEAFMVEYKLLTYESGAGPRAGVLVGDTIQDVARLTKNPAYQTVLEVLGDWRTAKWQIEARINVCRVSDGHSLAETKLLAPILYPSAVYCAGANYTDYQQEMERVQNLPAEPDPHSVGLKPWHFMKTSRSVSAPGTATKIPSESSMLDWEGELAVVIGRQAKNVSLLESLDYIAGYTIANDLSARDAMRRAGISYASPFQFDWIGQKCFDGACPLGPWIVPTQQVGYPQDLGIKLWVNDVLKQDSNSAHMIFTVAEQVSHLSTRITLNPGDLILTGSPAGVGIARGEYLKPGDDVRIWIEKIGTLTHTIS